MAVITKEKAEEIYDSIDIELGYAKHLTKRALYNSQLYYRLVNIASKLSGTKPSCLSEEQIEHAIKLYLEILVISMGSKLKKEDVIEQICNGNEN